MRLIIVRHGETEANVGRILQGQRDNSLSVRGKQQAAELARRLASESIDAFYSSDLERAKQTAQIISEGINIPVEFCPQLRERSYGQFEGRPVVEYETALEKSGLARELFVPPDGESLFELDRRTSQFISSIVSRLKGKTVLLVAHSGTNRAIIKTLLRKDFSDWLAIEQDNACVSVFELSDDRVDTILFNCTVHLAPTGFKALGVYE